MSLTKQDIANALVKKTDLTQTQALVLTNQFFEQIIETLSKGEMLNYPASVTLWFEKNLSDQVGTQKLEKRS